MTPAAAEQTWTIGALLDWTAKFLAQKGLEFPRLDAEVLLAHALGCKRIDLYGLRHGEIADEASRKQYKDLIRKRLEGCPVAYLTGKKEFFSLELLVTTAVLIPRPDSEVLVTECLDLARKVESPRIIDLGTGSGNLVVALAKSLPTARFTAVDLSSDALAVAQRNAEKHGVADRIQFVQGDLFQPIPADERFDFVISNPPYIPTGEIPQLAPGVRDYEPRLALDGGSDGYAVLLQLSEQAKVHLKPGGWLLVEIGSPQEVEAHRLLTSQNEYDVMPTVYDHSRHPRVLKAHRKS